MSKLFVIDGFSLAYRGHFALLRNPRMTSQGVNSSAVLVFANVLLGILEREKPENLVRLNADDVASFDAEVDPGSLAEFWLCVMPHMFDGALPLFLGILCSALAYLWWNRAYHALGVTTTNSLAYGMPLVAVIGGVLLLDEPLTPEMLVGGSLIILGLVIANYRRAGRPAA